MKRKEKSYHTFFHQKHRIEKKQSGQALEKKQISGESEDEVRRRRERT